MKKAIADFELNGSEINYTLECGHQVAVSIDNALRVRILALDCPTCTPKPAAKLEVNRNSTIQTIKAAFKARGLRYSVTGGRGTAWGWINIDLLPSTYKALDEESRRPEYEKMAAALMLDAERYGYTSISIPASSDYYREYIERANGREPQVCGEPYWD